VAREHLVAQHFGDFFGVARDFGADARLVADAVEPAAAPRFEKYAAARPERGAIELVFLVHLGAGEIGGGGDAVLDHALPFVGKHVDAGAAALLFAGKSSTVGLFDESERNHDALTFASLTPTYAKKSAKPSD
jgi:hypothetical protein